MCVHVSKMGDKLLAKNSNNLELDTYSLLILMQGNTLFEISVKDISADLGSPVGFVCARLSWLNNCTVT